MPENADMSSDIPNPEQVGNKLNVNTDIKMPQEFLTEAGNKLGVKPPAKPVANPVVKEGGK